MHRIAERVHSKASCLVAMAMLSACATEYDMQDVEAVRDFVFASQLKEVDEFRYVRQFSYTYINDYFVTVPTRTGDYLVEFDQECRAVGHSSFTPDMVDKRTDTNRIRARFDTIRGCRIGKIYEVTDEQSKELADLGDAPGDGVYLPQDDD